VHVSKITKVTYHCVPCKKEFVDMQLAKEHIDSTGETTWD